MLNYNKWYWGELLTGYEIIQISRIILLSAKLPFPED
jgi:hypothetical protein